MARTLATTERTGAEPMRVLACVCVAILLFPAESPASRGGSVELVLGGLTVGVSTLDDAKRQFDNLLTIERGMYVVHFGKTCDLSFNLEDVPTGKTPHRILAVSLRRTSETSSELGECDNVITGRGIKLSDSLEKVQHIYGKPVQEFVRNGVRVLGYDNSSLCSRPSVKSIELNGIGFEWSESSKKLINIHVETSSVECLELRSKR
jgi:hypothetical protein